MIKVKLFKSFGEKALEKEINSFIKGKVIKDIKFNIAKNESNKIIYNALVMYKAEGEEII